MNVLIVGRTRMGGSSRCIGGLAQDENAVRLLTKAGGHWNTSAPFQLGQIWDIEYVPVASPTPPHTEDAIISKYKMIRSQPNLRAHLLKRIEPWQGGIDQVFDGLLEYTASNNGYICEQYGVPTHSTGFWIPDRNLTLRPDGKHYDYLDGRLPRGLAYVGEPSAPSTIPAGALVRVSLARWWKPRNAEPDFEERCYLQLSGWFL